ncbi:MAG TPA: tetratricopeptide repeat protein [Planctomycetota bacterium]|jgi:tetratricopeptide (TPR) repeat protein|nr:tetratricopeptide repeat protein [Planctomycetota bacterium]
MRPARLVSLLFLLLPGCAGLFPLSSQQRRALDLHRQNAEYWYDAGDLNRAQQQARQALEIDPADREILLLLGWIHLKKGTRDDVYEAERYLSRVVGGGLFRKRWYKATLGLGLALRRQGDYLRDAADRVERGDIRLDAAKDPAREAERMRRRAEEKVAGAIELLEETVAFNPKDPHPLALDNLQQLHALHGDAEASLANGRRFVEQARVSRLFWSRKLEQPELSAEDERIARARLAENLAREVESRGLAANVLFKQGRFAEAAVELDALLSLDPERTDEYFNRARCRAELGRKEGAVADMEEFLRRTSLSFDAPQVLRAYDLIRGWGEGKSADAPPAEVPTAKSRS